VSEIEIVVLALFAALVGGWVVRVGLRWLDRWRRVTRARRAHRGEALARRLLERAGYSVEGEQVMHQYCYRCDGREVRAGLRVDFVVRRGRQRFVAEVKTGELVASLQHAPTRRQLLEYQCAFETDGVLLVDADSRQIHQVAF
jgi:hypothetical protein